MSEQPRERLISYQEVGTRLTLSRTAIWALVKAGELHPIHIGRAVRFRESEIDSWIAGRVSAQADGDARQPGV